MNTIDIKANSVAAQIANQGVDKSTAFDPMLILLIVSIIAQIVTYFIQHRQSASTALDRFKNPSILDRWALWWIVWQKLKKFPNLRTQVQNALYYVGANTTLEEVEQMYRDLY